MVLIVLLLLLFGGLMLGHFIYIRDTEKSGPLVTVMIMLFHYLFLAMMLFLVIAVAGGVDRIFVPR